MKYKELKKFELLQIVRVLWENYQDIKYNFEILSRWVDTLNLDFPILKKYKTFKNSLEKELKAIRKSREDDLEDFLYLFPCEIFKKRWRKKKIRISNVFKR